MERLSKGMEALDAVLRAAGLTKKFGTLCVLDDFTLEITRGEVVTLLGPSGCGKTTTLHIIAGIESPDGGEVYLRGENVTRLSPQRRRVGMVFQRWALFPHMTAYENVAFGLQMRRMKKPAIRQQVAKMLAVVSLPDVAEKYPSQLSGGMQQRVAVARALATDPDLLLLDEPFSNLDEKLRRGMQIEMKSIQESIGITTLCVTHNQEEALVLSDRVAVMFGGKIVQMGKPEELYSSPNSRFVCGFLGDANTFEGTIVGTQDGKVTVAVGAIVLSGVCSAEMEPGKGVFVSVRPERVGIVRSLSEERSGSVLHGHVKEIHYKGATTAYVIDVQGVRFEAVEPSGASVRRLCKEQKVGIEIEASAVLVLDTAGEGGA
jgi:ABC-type Fe3+/spermidine/putrescine transport system ATPase subunit